MFLSQLKEENKEKFLELCVLASLSNGVFAKEEKETVELYCQELDIPSHIPEVGASLDEVVSAIVGNSDESERKIMYLEILGLVKSDNAFDDEEKEFMASLAKGLKIEPGDTKLMSSLLDMYLVIYKELVSAVYE